jgi:Putative phage serine protease XkdF
VSSGPRPSRFASDARGVAAMDRTSGLVVTAAELREQAEGMDALAKCAGTDRIVDGEATTPEAAASLAKMLRRAGEHVVSFADDQPGLAASLESGGAYVWKVAGLEGSLFASPKPPAWHPRLRPLSSQKDFPKPKTRQIHFLRKDEGGPELEKQIVYGIVLEPETTDTQGDIYSANEIENTAHRYLEEFQTVGHMHQTMLDESSVRVCESYLAPCDFEMGGQKVKAGTWIIAMHVLNDALWQQIKSGDLTGYSIGGYGQRVPLDETG